MSLDVPVSAEKSTNGRSSLWFRYDATRRRAADARGAQVARGLLSLFAPQHAEAQAVTLFGTPNLDREQRRPEVKDLTAVHSRLAFGTGSLAVTEWGQGPAILLVHGWNGHAGQLRAFVAPLVAAGRRVVAFDQPAHGRSSGNYATVLDLAAAVRAVARAYGPFDALIAHSLGATASALALHAGLEIPRAVLMAPPENVRYFARAFGERLGLSSVRIAGMLEQLRQRLGGDLEALDLRSLELPAGTAVMLLHDRGDKEVPFAHSEALAAAWPAARFVPLDGLGHTRVLRDPSVIARATAFTLEPAGGPRSSVEPLRAA